MLNKKKLAAGVRKMREVAFLLSQWADDMEASMALDAEIPETPVAATTVPEPSVDPAESTETQTMETPADPTETAEIHTDPAETAESPAESVDPAETAKPLATPTAPTFAEMRRILSDRCAAGYGSQVKALIASFGFEKLSDVPQEHYAELLSAVQLLGGEEGEPYAG